MSKRASSNLDLAATLLQLERGPHAPASSAAIASAFGRLHDVMSKLIGSAGYRALLARAIYVARHEHAWLDALIVAAPPFAIHQLDEQVALVGEARALEGGTVLLATLLDLFCAFIGDDLTLRQVHEVWTDVAVGEAHAASGGDQADGS